MESAPRSPNGFLSSLTAADFESIRPHLRTVDLQQEAVLAKVDETLERAYMPHHGVISLMVRLSRGEHVQIAMIGRDSILGSFAALGDAVALDNAVVLVSGAASTIDVDRLRDAADHSTTLRTALVRHGLAVYAQIQQTAGCNAAHTVESRLARCLLQTRDLSGSDKLVLTQQSIQQEFLGEGLRERWLDAKRKLSSAELEITVPFVIVHDGLVIELRRTYAEPVIHIG